MTTTIASIIVTYNRLENLKLCIQKLRNSTLPTDIIVVNNASTDGTKDWLDSVKNELALKVIHSETNIGGAGGFNLGIKQAVKDNYDRIWIMDDDCYVFPDSLENLTKADEALEGNFGWLSSIALWNDGKPCLMNRQKASADFYTYSHFLNASLLLSTQATFVSLYLKKETVQKVGLPIKEFFIWGDDVEYTRRISVRENIPSFIVGNSRVRHAMKDNNGSSIASDSETRINRYKFAYRNEAYLYRQEGLKGLLYFFAKCCLNTFRILAKAKDHKIKRLWVLHSSALKGLFFNPPIEKV